MPRTFFNDEEVENAGIEDSIFLYTVLTIVQPIDAQTVHSSLDCIHSLSFSYLASSTLICGILYVHENINDIVYRWFII